MDGKSPLSNEDQEPDLTLRLGRSNIDKQESEDHKNKAEQARGNVGVGGSSSTQGGGGVHVANFAAPYPHIALYAPNPANFAFYQHALPQDRPNPTGMRHGADDRVCQACGATATPLWRKGPNGPQTLCNACGLRYARVINKHAD